MLCNGSYYGNYRTRTFNQIYPNEQELINDYYQIYPNTMERDKLVTLYFLLASRYMNSHIVNKSEDQFKLKLVSIIFCYGPTWASKLDIQKKLRELPEADIITGSKAIYNHANNPSTLPSTSSLEELRTIDEQNTQTFKKSKLDAYSLLWEMLVSDVTTQFLTKFKDLFIKIAQPDYPLWYVSEDDEDEEEDN